jgi:hypothetical protein
VPISSNRLMSGGLGLQLPPSVRRSSPTACRATRQARFSTPPVRRRSRSTQRGWPAGPDCADVAGPVAARHGQDGAAAHPSCGCA